MSQDFLFGVSFLPLFSPSLPLFLSFFFFNFYLFMIVTERERERERRRDTGRGRSRLHASGARRGIRSQVSRIVPWAKGRRQTAVPPRDPKDFIYLFVRDTKREREAETQAEGGAGSMQGVWRGTRSWDSRITPWAEGRCLNHWATQASLPINF